MRKINKVIGVALAILMIASVLPLTTFAADTEKLAVAEGSSLVISGDIVRGLRAADTKFSTIRAQFANDAVDVAAYRDGVALADNELVGTGVVIKLSKAGAVADEKTVILYGDVDGDGVIGEKDIDLLIGEAVMGVAIDGDAFRTAADINEDGVIDAFDIARVDLQVSGKRLIDQKGGIPGAIINEIDKTSAGSNGQLTGYNSGLTVDADAAIEILASETLEEIAEKEYKNWAVDIELSFNKDIDGNDVYLFGQYADWGWLGDSLAQAPAYNGTVTAGTKVALVKDWLASATGFNVTVDYTDIVKSVADMKAAIHVENPEKGLIATIELVVTDPATGDRYVISTYNYEFETLPEIELTELPEKTIDVGGSDVIVDTAVEFETIQTIAEVEGKYYEYWNVDFVLSFNKAVDGSKVRLFGQYGSYGWTGAALPAGDAPAAIYIVRDVLNDVLPYRDIVETVGKFDCAIDVVEPEDGLVATLSLILIDPATDEEYVISTYTYTFAANDIAEPIVEFKAADDVVTNGEIPYGETTVPADVAVEIDFNETFANISDKEFSDWGIDVVVSFNKPVAAENIYLFGKYGAYDWMGEKLSLLPEYAGKTFAADEEIDLLKQWFGELGTGFDASSVTYGDVVMRTARKIAALHVDGDTTDLAVTAKIILTNPVTGETMVLAEDSYSYAKPVAPEVIRKDVSEVAPSGTIDYKGVAIPVDTAVEVKFNETASDVADKPYKDWQTDVVMSFSKPVDAENVYLFGKYGLYDWMGGKLSDSSAYAGKTFAADEEIGLLKEWFSELDTTHDFSSLTYEDVVRRTAKKLAAIHVDGDTTDLTVTVKVIVTDPDTGIKTVLAEGDYSFAKPVAPEVIRKDVSEVVSSGTIDYNGEAIPVDTAVKVEFKETAADVADKPYKDWQTEVVVSFSEAVSADSVYIFGKYGLYDWMGGKLSDSAVYAGKTFAADEEIDLVQQWFGELGTGVNVSSLTYEDVVRRTATKLAAIHIEGESAGLVVTVKVVVTDPDTGIKTVLSEETYAYADTAAATVETVSAASVGDGGYFDTSYGTVPADVAIQLEFTDTVASIENAEYKDWDTEIEVSFNQAVAAEDVYFFGKYGTYDWMGDSLAVSPAFAGRTIQANERIKLVDDWFAAYFYGPSATDVDATYEKVVARTGDKLAALHIEGATAGLEVTVNIVLTNPATGERTIIASGNYVY